MDFLRVGVKTATVMKKDSEGKSVKVQEQLIFPKFVAVSCKDLLIQGGDFYAAWDENKGVWTTNENDIVRMVDEELDRYKQDHPELEKAHIAYMWDGDSGMIDKWHKYVQKQLRDNSHPLDEKLIFSNSGVRREDYSSKRLSYPLEEGDISAYNELMHTLYSPEELHKLEWAIGAVVSGDSKTLQKFIVLYGDKGTGKSTVLHIIEALFEGYCVAFDSKALGTNSNSFALEPFAANPLVAIDHDGDLSHIDDNVRLNKIISHEDLVVNEKFKKTYPMSFKCMLFVATNKPVKITDSRSGIIRRLINVSPTENKVPIKRYRQLKEKIKFELGGIAWHCLQVYEENKDFYEDYIPSEMLGATNDFYNFIVDQVDDYLAKDGVTLNAAWTTYTKWCQEASVPYPFSKRIFKEEMKNYFRNFEARGRDADGTQVWNYYSGFKKEKLGIIFSGEEQSKPKPAEIESRLPDWLQLKRQKSLFDEQFASAPAQEAKSDGSPKGYWAECKTTLSMISSSLLHYVLTQAVEPNHIVIDFDLKNPDGTKSRERNLEAAALWPKTYAEYSKSGSGVHLHYIYDGDVSMLSRIYDEDIEIKVFTGNSSLRRQLTECNDIPVAHISSGLPIKEEKPTLNFDGVKNDIALKTIIRRVLLKEYHGGYTKPNIDLLYKVLEDAYNSGMHYDVSAYRPAVEALALNSTHNAKYCNKLVDKMHFKSDEPSDTLPTLDDNFDPYDISSFTFYDVECFQNLFLVSFCIGEGEPEVWINPDAEQMKELFKMRLIGFNNRRYDNHICYARMQGFDLMGLYKLSQRIVGKKSDGMFNEAYNLSYTDIYDFCAKKQSLKKWEIELGIHHHELGLPWDQPVPEELWQTVAEYCKDDVRATREVFRHNMADYKARLFLVKICHALGMPACPNDSTNQLTTRIIVRNDPKPQEKFVYTDLREMFPGYEFKDGVSTYMDEEVGEGGRVYAEPGMYGHVRCFDISGMHPASIRALNLFGEEYTKNFGDIVDLRLYIKHREIDKACSVWGGVLKDMILDIRDNEDELDGLAYALKIAVNSVYGQTAATYPNKLRDPRNIDNIVAKRGALFMMNLQKEVQKLGYQVVHIKTDSIKVVDPTPEIEEFIVNYGRQYGYNFEVESDYEKFCLVNNAVYIAKCTDNKCNKKHAGHWTATGKQFQVPYVFKTLFSHEPIEFDDMCETFSVTSALYLDMNETLPDVSALENERDKLAAKLRSKKLVLTDEQRAGMEARISELNEQIKVGHAYHFVGKAGQFCPILPGKGGGILLRQTNTDSYAAAVGTTGYRWLESEMVRNLGKQDDIDKKFYRAMVDDAVAAISEFGDFESFAE